MSIKIPPKVFVLLNSKGQIARHVDAEGNKRPALALTRKDLLPLREARRAEGKRGDRIVQYKRREKGPRATKRAATEAPAS